MSKTKRLLNLPRTILKRWAAIANYAGAGVAQSFRLGQYLLALKIFALGLMLAAIAVLGETCRAFDKSTAGEDYDSNFKTLNQEEG